MCSAPRFVYCCLRIWIGFLPRKQFWFATPKLDLQFTLDLKGLLLITAWSRLQGFLRFTPCCFTCVAHEISFLHVLLPWPFDRVTLTKKAFYMCCFHGCFTCVAHESFFLHGQLHDYFSVTTHRYSYPFYLWFCPRSLYAVIYDYYTVALS